MTARFYQILSQTTNNDLIHSGVGAKLLPAKKIVNFSPYLPPSQLRPSDILDIDIEMSKVRKFEHLQLTTKLYYSCEETFANELSFLSLNYYGEIYANYQYSINLDFETF